MGRHIIDRTKPRSDETRLRTFLEMERRSGIHPAIRSLSQRPTTRDEGGRKLREYTRIERGHQA